MSTQLEVSNIRCRYGNETAVDEVSFTLDRGTLACLLGPSGCGKTTVLRAIAGFHRLEQGEIMLNGNCVSSPTTSLLPEKRQLGMVFQDHALFPHLSVRANVAAGLLKESVAQKKIIVTSLLERMGLVAMQNRYPHELSGGQQQRVALARALAPNPRLILMDEPYSNLDVELRERLGQEVQDLLKETGTTAILVTHDQQDAFTFGEQVGVMNAGRIEQWETPYMLYHQPVNRFVADFIGEGVFVPGVMTASNTVETELGKIESCKNCQQKQGKQVEVMIRPDDIVIDSQSMLKVKVSRKAFRGAEIHYRLRLTSGREVLALFPSHANYEVGDEVGIRLDARHLVCFPLEDG